MVAAAAGPAGAPSRPPATIEDFLWNIHSVLAAQNGPLPLDNLKDAYSAHLGHKCAVERFLVVGEGGLGATLKRIPHIVTLFNDAAGVPSVKATQAITHTKQDVIEADQAYRRELVKKNALAKAAAAKGAPAKAPAPAATGAKAAPAATPAAGSPPTGEKRAADGAAAGAPASKQAKAASPAGAPAAAAGDSDTETLARMLVQGVVRVLQNREKAGKGPLPIGELEAEFKALWKVPFNLAQASETDAVTFLQKWPNKVEVSHDASGPLVQLPKKGAAEKPKANPTAVKAATPAVPAEAKKGTDAPATAPKPAGPPPAKAATPGTAPKAAPGKAAEPEAAKNGDIGKRAGGPTRPPATIEDFLWNMHTVLEAYGSPLPAEQLKEVYSKHLGHKCAIERFLVVGDGGLAATLKRIPHVVTVVAGNDGSTVLQQTLPNGINREQLVAADQAYRKQLQAKNAAGKAPPGAPSAAGTAATAAATPAKAPEVAAATPATATPAAAQTRPAPDAAAGPDAKKPRPEDADTLAKMMIQGIVRVLQNRGKEGKGPLPIADLEEEFRTLWKVPFQLRQAGETDLVAFLEKWPQKVELSTEGGVQVLALAKKGAKGPKDDGADAAAPAPKTLGEITEPQTLAQAQQQAAEQLAAMRDMVRRQEALVNALGRLTA